MNTHIDATGRGRWPLWILGAVLAVSGLFLGINGGRLVALGGSWYFLLAGVGLLAAGVLIAMRKPVGAWIYAVLLVLTVAWAVWDAGFAFWPLVSRLALLGGLGIFVALAYPTLVRATGQQAGRAAYGIAAVLAAALVAMLGFTFVPANVISATGPAPSLTPVAADGAKDWRHWGNTVGGTRFGPLDQINKQNVDKLQVAWTFRTGDIPQSNGFGAEDQGTPIQVGDAIYLCTAHNQVFALDADTGAKRWSYDPKATAPNWQRCRGVAYFEEPAGANAQAASAAAPAAADCRRRILTTTIDARLIALDADTGKPCAGFGNQGTVDLKVGMGEVKPGFYTLTAAPLVAGDLIVLGGRVADNIEVNEPSGVIRAFDVRTGKLAWVWDLSAEAAAQPRDPNRDYSRATPNVWTSMAYDEKLGLVYLPTGNTTPDAWGGQRTPQDDKYSSSVVALDVKTGKERWVFQTARHDLWDYDVPAQPTLVDVPDTHGSGTLPGLVQVTKSGQIFLLNRETGQPIAEVRETPVPQGKATGERYSPTQPMSVGLPSIGTETLTESKMWGGTLFDQLLCRIEFKKMRYEGMYTPPGEDLALQWPGSLGGMNWGGVSVDPTTGYVFVNDMRLGLWNRLIPRAQMENSKAGGVEMGAASQTGTPYGSLRDRFLSHLGIPCQQPPYGTMSAIDLKTRRLAWQVPVGTVQDTGPFGIKMHLPIPIGMPTLGGSLATQSGLVFFAGTQDYYLRAFDAATGKEVWKQRLPVGSQGTPMTYQSTKTGKQYVVLMAGGARQSPDRGDYVIAYALPGDAAK
jgi:quinate dehydrogenase (quinone)